MKNPKVENLEAEISKLQEEYAKKLQSLSKEKEAALAMTDSMVIAEELHARLCHSDHTDGCGWFYGSWETPRSEHQKYLNKAVRLITACTNRNIDPSMFLELFDRIKD